MFDNLKNNELLLLTATDAMPVTFQTAHIRMLLATISELRARNIAVQEVKDECDGGVLDKVELNKHSSVLIAAFYRWINNKSSSQLFDFTYDENNFIISAK